MFEKEPQSFKTENREEKEVKTSQEEGKLLEEALKKNEKLQGEIWIGGWMKRGGQVDQKCKEFFEAREVNASEAVRFFTEKGEFRKPNEKRIKELKEAGKEEEAAIEIIQNLPLPARDRTELLLCFLGEKPATTFINKKFQFHSEISEGAAKLLQKKEGIIKDNLSRLNLVYKIEDEREETSSKGEIQLFQLFHISKSRDTLEKLVETWRKEGDEEKQCQKEKQRGLLYGYPPTAVEAWVKSVIELGIRPLGERCPKSDPYVITRKEIPNYFPEEKRGEIENIAKFANFNFSREHWQEELNELKRMVEIIKKKAPDLYEEFLSSEEEL